MLDVRGWLWTGSKSALGLLSEIVVLVFLQNGRATLIPLIAIPVSLVGTFAGMAAFGCRTMTVPATAARASAGGCALPVGRCPRRPLFR